MTGRQQDFVLSLLGTTPGALARTGLEAAGCSADADRVTLRFASPDGSALSIHLERRDEDRKAYARSDTLNLSYSGTPAPGQVPRLVAALIRRARGVPFEALVRAVEAVADRVPPAPPGGPGPEGESRPGDSPDDRSRARPDADPGASRDGDRPAPGDPAPRDRHRPDRDGDRDDDRRYVADGLHESWAHPDRWRTFLAGNEIHRAKDGVLRIDLPWTFVEHGDFECQHVGVGDFLDYPWDPPPDRGPARPVLPPVADGAPDATPSGRPPPSSGHRFRSLRTDMDDLDVIEGGRRKLERIFEALRNDVHPEAVTLNCTCVPVLTGDDPADLVREERERCPFPILYQAQETGDRNPRLDAVLRRFRDVPADEADPDAVNLVGFRPGPETDELRDLLGRLGLTVNASAVPVIDPSVGETWDRAAMQIVLDHEDWRATVDALFANRRPRTLVCRPPFGPRAIRSWLAEVAAFAGRDDRLPDALRSVDEALGDGWDARVAAAGAHAVGVVASHRQVPRLVDPARNWGLPLLPVLEELGFAIRVALFDDGRSTDADASAILATLSDPARHRVHAFRTPDDLDAFLRADGLSLVYTDYAYDHRVTSAGRTPFAGSVFEMGAGGAARTMDRLAALCRLRFYRENGRFLRRGDTR